MGETRSKLDIQSMPPRNRLEWQASKSDPSVQSKIVGSHFGEPFAYCRNGQRQNLSNVDVELLFASGQCGGEHQEGDCGQA